MGKYVDYNGIRYLWQKMLAKFAPLTRAIPSGGTSGQVLTKSSATDYDVGWTTPSSGGGSVTGVKGNAESAYRTGNVNLTPANVGAAPTSHASTATTYGAATGSNYGHTRLSNSYASTSGTSGGYAATPKAVTDALAEAKTYADGVLQPIDSYTYTPSSGTASTHAWANHVKAWEADASGVAVHNNDDAALLAFCTSGNDWDDTEIDTVDASTARSIIDAAESSHTHAATDITSGTLPVARGGTGQTSVANARNYLCCKQLFNGTAATSVTLSESYSNFKFLVVLLTTNSAGTAYHTAVIRSTGSTQITTSILSGDWAYLKGGTLTLSASGSTYTLALSGAWNKGLNLTSATVDSGSKSEASLKIKQVWGVR